MRRNSCLSLAVWPQGPHTPPAEEDSVGDCAQIAPVWPGQLTDGAATGHTVQFGKRKSWGGGATPRDQRGKSGSTAGGCGGKSDRMGTTRTGEGAESGPGVAPACSQAWLPGFPGRERSGHKRLLIAASRVLPGSSAAAGRARRPNWRNGGSWNTSSKGSGCAGRSAAPQRRLGEGEAPRVHSLSALHYRMGFQLEGGSLRANLGRRGSHRALAGKTTPSLPAQPALRSHSAQQSFGVPAAPPSPRGPESWPIGPRRRRGKFVRPGLGDR